MRPRLPSCSFVLIAVLLAGCMGSYDPANELPPPPAPLPENVAFELREDFDGPCVAEPTIDVNLGQTPESFVRAANCQINGVEPSPDLVATWSPQLETDEWVRRIDVVRSLCIAAGKAASCPLSYSDPWKEQVLLSTPCVRKTQRDVGAILMFFSECPDGVNCGLDWANTHVSGMAWPHQLYAFGDAEWGYYHPDNAGFWRRELIDAQWAGLSFMLVNTYGPDIGHLGSLREALADIDGGIQVALMDDTSVWGGVSQPPPWNAAPDLSDTAAAAQTLYQAKWKPFFQAIAREDWYLVKGRPLIYFYNGGTLAPLKVAAGVVAALKQLFAADFGVEPFVAVDSAFFEDPSMPSVADSEFVWDTHTEFVEGRHIRAVSHFDLAGVTHDHFMVRWDPLGRDDPGVIATAADDILKGPEPLTRALANTATSDLVVFATWNDLGEGTGINRNYDYYDQGRWLPPNAFMSILRGAQCE
jgi:Domain of unknown function (DUF5010)